MSDEPLISIVTPSFNMGRFLERALESVHGQSDRIEHIVVDEATDVLREHARVHGQHLPLAEVELGA